MMMRKTMGGLVFFISMVATVLLVISSSIAVPILVRPFYYLHISMLRLPEITGLSTAAIHAAYNDVIDYCLGLQTNFSAGSLPWSESGADHFADVRFLFQLDLAVLGISLAVLLGVFLLKRLAGWRSAVVLRHGAGFWASILLIVAAAALGCWIAADFNQAFVTFHTLFFPGKDNWIFDGRTDPIIYLLPETFFRNCALLIITLLVLWCVGLILWDIISKRKKKNRGTVSRPDPHFKAA